jgi:hypothetical protein
MKAAPLLAALLLLLPSWAEAAPTALTVRIEGATRTLFEGPILSDGHDVQASSDTQPRHCDGTNGGAHPAPGPTPTAAAVDAMGLIGRDFDGRWYPGFDDYLVERWGPDAEDPEASAFWGLLVDGVLAPVGGCQWQNDAGDEVVWAYDAFTGRELLRLSAATAAVEVGQPLEVLVESYSGGEGEEPAVEPAGGVSVAPVATEPGDWFQTVEVASPAAVLTAGDGTASVSFDSPGWRRLKAEEDAGFIRSNRLDVCVEPVGGGSCGPLPADAQVRVPERYVTQQLPLGSPGGGGGGAGNGPGTAAPDLRLARIKLDPRRGTATVAAVVSGAGRLRLGGRGVRPIAVASPAAGSVSLLARPTAEAMRALRRSGRFEARLQVAFAAGGGAVARTRRVALRLRGPD